ncbi:MAG: DUF4388 domain-containing protein [Desulfobacteraceae bacterium]|nr:DUF4388 domain-containing protein [Desulfobacteraceae bacterium]
MKSSDFHKLTLDSFPKNDFFEHLEGGTDFYQKFNYRRSIEELAAAGVLRYSNPIKLKTIKGRIVFRGDFAQIPFLFMLYAISMSRLSGVSILKSETKERKYVFKEGNIIRIAATEKKDRIGEYIIRRKILTPEELNLQLKELKRKKKRLGTWLVEKRYIKEKTLRELLALQTEERFSDSMFWEQGQFFFKEMVVNESSLIEYSPVKLAWIAIHRGFNFDDFRKEIPNNKVIFEPVLGSIEDKDKTLIKLDANYQFIFYLVDGARNIDQLIQFSRNNERSIINILYKLSSFGLIRKTAAVNESEDQAYNEVKMIIGVLFDIYHIVIKELTDELGEHGKILMKETQSKLKQSYLKTFDKISLDKPEELKIDIVLQNISRSFPFPEKRFTFIDAFLTVYKISLDKLKRELGVGLRAKTIKKMQVIIGDMERFAMDTELKSYMMQNLKRLIK